MLLRAHASGIRVVAWYLPKFYDLDSDMRRLLAMRDFRADGQGFDGIGLDIEWTKDVPNAAERNVRLIDLSRRLRRPSARAALSAIPLPPVLIETINPRYWPDFPWRELAPLYDVWMPMAYWTFRTQSSGYRDAYRYTEENVRRMRINLGLPDAVVHPIGGTDNKSSDDDYRNFVRACVDSRSIGGSIYDWRTTPMGSYGILRGVRLSRSALPVAVMAVEVATAGVGGVVVVVVVVLALRSLLASSAWASACRACRRGRARRAAARNGGARPVAESPARPERRASEPARASEATMLLTTMRLIIWSSLVVPVAEDAQANPGWR